LRSRRVCDLRYGKDPTPHTLHPSPHTLPLAPLTSNPTPYTLLLSGEEARNLPGGSPPRVAPAMHREDRALLRTVPLKVDGLLKVEERRRAGPRVRVRDPSSGHAAHNPREVHHLDPRRPRLTSWQSGQSGRGVAARRRGHGHGGVARDNPVVRLLGHRRGARERARPRGGNVLPVPQCESTSANAPRGGRGVGGPDSLAWCIVWSL